MPLCGDGIALVCQMAGIVERAGSGTEIVAASLKTPAEAVEAILNGAHHVTIPLQLIERWPSTNCPRWPSRNSPEWLLARQGYR